MSLRGQFIREKQRIKTELDKRQPLLRTFTAVIGDGEGNIYPDANNLEYVFVRRTGRGRVERVRNTRVKSLHNLPVIVGFAPERPDVMQVLDTDDVALGNALGQQSYMPNHHQQHELFNSAGGDDTVWVYTQQFMYLLVQVTDPVSLQLDIRSGFYVYRGNYILFPGALTPNMSIYDPGVANQAVMVLIYIDATTGNIAYKPSLAFSTALPVEARPAMIPGPPSGSIPLAGVYIPNGVAEVDWDYITDCRIFITTLGDSQSHSICSPTHIDATTDTLVRGDIFTVNSAALMQRQAHPGIANRILRTPDVNDISWSDWSLVGTAAQTYTFSATGGTVPTGTGNAGEVAYWGAASTLTGEAAFSYTAGTDTLNVGNVNLPDTGWIGIAANELLTFNAAGNATFSGITSVVVPDGCWVGADASNSWVYDATNGDVSTFANVSIGKNNPLGLLDVYGANASIRIDNTNVANATTILLLENGVLAGSIVIYASAHAWNADEFWFKNYSATGPIIFGPNNTEQVRIISTGSVSIGGVVVPLAKLHIDQPSASGAIPVALFDQADLSEEIFEVTTTVGAGNPIDTAAIGTYYGKMRVSVTGVGYKYIALYNS